MKEYIIRKMAPGQGLSLPREAFDPSKMPNGFEHMDQADLSEYPWDENGYRPRAFARVGWNEHGIHVLMAALEPEVRCEVTETGGPACQDSCLEFFLMPAPELGKAYVNIEATPRAVLHLGLGEGRHGRRVFHTLPECVDSAASRHEGAWWAVRYSLPANFLRDQFGCELRPGIRMRGNFYKCGDMTRFPHWGMWQAYALAAPDFHRPELFANLTLG